jgi:hypothetical protein
VAKLITDFGAAVVPVGRLWGKFLRCLTRLPLQPSRPKVERRLPIGRSFDHRAPSQHPVGNANPGEGAEKPTEQMKWIIEFLGRADLDAMLAECTSARDEAELKQEA